MLVGPIPQLRRSRTHSVGGAVARFALTGFVVVLLVGLAGVQILRHYGRDEAVYDAKELTALAGNGVVGPAVTPALLRGDKAAIAQMDRTVDRVTGGAVVRVKLWDGRGRVVYSDEHRLIGTRHALVGEEREALLTGRSDAELSDLSEPENKFERRYGKLMEVYLGIRAPSGERLLFETYQRYSAVASGGRRLWLPLLPVLLGALGLLAALQMPAAWSLARRVKASEEERLRALERAIDAQERERRRIASDLHDGVVQTLVGISYRLGAARKHVDETTPQPLVRAVDESSHETRSSIRALRSLLVDIYPPSLQRQGLVAALSDLTSRATTHRLKARLDAPAEVELPPVTEALLFRTAQEALRNVVTHADAKRVTIGLERVNGHVELSVLDDGRGFDNAVPRRSADGHFGLVAIEDLVHEQGGKLDVASRVGIGTRVRVEVPVR
jgi:two-component system, NarL family, sensor kinase